MFKDVCMVTVTAVGTSDENVNQGCLPISIDESDCRTRERDDKGKFSVSCCCKNADNCDNDAFVKACRDGAYSGSAPAVTSTAASTVVATVVSLIVAILFGR